MCITACGNSDFAGGVARLRRNLGHPCKGFCRRRGRAESAIPYEFKTVCSSAGDSVGSSVAASGLAAAGAAASMAGSGPGIIFISPQRPIHSTTTATEIEPTTERPITANSSGSCVMAAISVMLPSFAALVTALLLSASWAPIISC